MVRLKIFLIAVTKNNHELIMQVNRKYLFIVVWSCDIIWCPEALLWGHLLEYWWSDRKIGNQKSCSPNSNYNENFASVYPQILSGKYWL